MQFRLPFFTPASARGPAPAPAQVPAPAPAQTPAPAGASAAPPQHTRSFRLQAESSAEPELQIHFVRMRRARRYVMRLRPDGALRVTIPRGGSQAEARRFAERHRDWALRQRSKLLAAKRPLSEEKALKAQALRDLPPRLHELAALHGLVVERVTIRDQRSRWGSCSSKGRIALNYRLMLMPQDVRDYILIHELMHMKQADHSRKFWRFVEAACPGFRDAERWLRKNGASLF